MSQGRMSELESRVEELEADLATARAETAAMLEKTANLTLELVGDEDEEWGHEIHDQIHALISTDQAAALTERDKKTHYDGACWMLDSIRATLRGYPDHDGDIEVMKEVDRIVAERERKAVDAAVLEEAEEWGTHFSGARGIGGYEQKWIDDRCAAHRAKLEKSTQKEDKTK